MLNPADKLLNYAREDNRERDGMRLAGGENGPRQLAALLRIEDLLTRQVELLEQLVGASSLDEAAEAPPRRKPGRPPKSAPTAQG